MVTVPSVHGSARNMYLRPRLFVLAAVTAIACVCSATGAFRPAVVVPLAIFAIAIAMWHGAYDHLRGRALFEPRFGVRWPFFFFPCYGALAFLTFAAWRLFPTPSLLLFLGYSAWHFGLEPEQTRPTPAAALGGFALGAVPIVCACYWHPAAVAPIFAAMLGRAGANASAVTHALGMLCWSFLAIVAAAIGSGVLLRSAAGRLELAAATALQIALFAICDPVVAFAVFFCCWHTPEHLLVTAMPAPTRAALLRRTAANLRAGFGPWLLSVLFLGALLAWGRAGIAAHEGALFILLSALTVPHMALEELRRFVPDSGGQLGPGMETP